MNNEEFERKMAFIVEQQARFAAGLEQMREIHHKTENVVGMLEQATFVGVKEVNVKFSSSVALQTWLTEAQIQLTQSQKQTEEKLQKLKRLVDRFKDGRNNN